MTDFIKEIKIAHNATVKDIIKVYLNNKKRRVCYEG